MSEANGNGHVADLYRKYRPFTLDDVVGQEAAVKTIRGFGKRIPKAVMLVGDSGCGKTSLARIMCRILNVSGADPSRRGVDLCEINCATAEPLETIREIQTGINKSALGGDARAWILDEVQSLSRATFAQQGLLKILEDGGPENAHFFLCTTDPKKVNAAVRNRCCTIAVGPIAEPLLRGLVAKVAKAEGVTLDEAVTARIVEGAEGSARRALVNLQQVIGLSSREEQLKAVGGRAAAEKVAFDLVKVLLPFKGSPDWKQVAPVLEGIGEEDPETVRQIMLKAARTTLLKGGPQAHQAYMLIQIFRDTLYDRNSGHAILAANCWEAVNPGKR